MEDKKVKVTEPKAEIKDDALSCVSGGRKYAIPREDATPSTPGIYDSVPKVPVDLDPGLLHW